MTMTEIQQSPTASRQLDGAGNQYLTFLLAGEEYGVDILRVQEIKGWDRVTPIPNTNEYVLGVINLRGAVVPIIDLRLLFRMEKAEYTKTTVMMVLKVHCSTGERTMGFVVDAVSDVYSVSEDQLQPPPDLGRAQNANYVKSLATVEGKMIILLDIDQLIDLSVEAVSAKN